MANVSTTRIATTDRPAAPLAGAPDLLVKGRTELKYSLPGPIADAALREARRYLPHDTFAIGPQQLVTSLYLDTAHLRFLRWHRERVLDRFKLRIRRYGDHAAATLYAEVKRKTGSVVRKHRAAFPADALNAVLNAPVGGILSDPARAPIGLALSDPALEEFVWHRSRCGAKPTMLVTCVRESLRDPRDGTAVTVDRDLRYQPTCRWDTNALKSVFLANSAGALGEWRSIPLPDAPGRAKALLELKYVLDPEPWMATLIEQLAPWRVSFSKYAAAMTASVPAVC
ncbi:MAG: polyphosphate polymerase domain-containing protein [Vicinamibacterales bacterium]